MAKICLGNRQHAGCWPQTDISADYWYQPIKKQYRTGMYELTCIFTDYIWLIVKYSIFVPFFPGSVSQYTTVKLATEHN